MGFNWRVMPRNTMRAYEQAAKDFETVTGFPVRFADDVSVATWQASMEARGLSVNTIRTRLSAVAVITGIKITLPKRQSAETPRTTLSMEQVKALMSNVSDRSDRMVLVKLLTLGMRARSIAAQTETFGAHFAGSIPDRDPTTQQLSRMLKRYAAKAGMKPEQISLRVWCLTGQKLVNVLSVRELVDLLGHSDTSQVDWRPLHGIGRRNGSRSVSV